MLSSTIDPGGAVTGTEDELVRMVNDAELGLVASVCARDPKLAPS